LERNGLGKSLFTGGQQDTHPAARQGDLSPHGRKECQVSDRRVVLEGRPVPPNSGAALKAHQRRRTGISLRGLDDPALGRPLNVALMPSDYGQSAILIWSRPPSAKRKCDIDRRPPSLPAATSITQRLFAKLCQSFRVATLPAQLLVAMHRLVRPAHHSTRVVTARSIARPLVRSPSIVRATSRS